MPAARVWTAEMAAAWRSALDYFGAVMSAAAAADAQSQPAWWTGEVVQHDRRTETVAVLTIRPDQPLQYPAGQYIEVQAPRWPRIWRRYSIANAPAGERPDRYPRPRRPGRAGQQRAGQSLRHRRRRPAQLGARRHGACRRIRAATWCASAGGTGLAPVKAITEEVVGAARHGRRRAITLYVGARRSRDLYDMRDLETLRLAYPSLTVIPVAEHELDFAGRVGRPARRGRDAPVLPRLRCLRRRAGRHGQRHRAGAVPPGARDRLHHDPLDALQLARRPPRPDALVSQAERMPCQPRRLSQTLRQRGIQAPSWTV